MKPFSKTKAAPGFTNIEIMVVISILAILLMFLIPLLSRTRDMSYKAQCASNLKQFSNAFTLYANDWSGYWPAPGGLYGDRTYWSQSGGGGLNPYIKQRGLKTIWCCPMLTDWGGQFPPRSYSMNSYLRTFRPPTTDVEYPASLSTLCGIRYDRISVPSKTIQLFEGMPLTNGATDTLDYLYRCANWTKVRGYASKVANTIEPGKPWHGACNNYLYCDGHVVSRPPGKMATVIGSEEAVLNSSLSTGSEMYLWYVDKSYYMKDVWPKREPKCRWN